MDDSAATLLWEILRGELPPGLSAARLDEFFQLAADHGLITALNEVLQERGLNFPLWEEGAQSLELRTRLQLQTAAEVCAALRKHAVPCVLFKGAALALTVYPRSAARTFTDLDFLIPPEALTRTHEALSELGFALKRSTLGNPIEVSYLRERLPGFPVEIDVHWAYPGNDNLQAPVRVPLAAVIARAEVVRGCPVPSLEDSLLLAATNFTVKLAVPLMLVVDFTRLTQKPLNWPVVVERAGQWRVRTPLWLGLDLAATLLKAPVPPDTLAQLAPPRWQARWLRSALSGPRLWRTDKQSAWRYRVLFRALCLDSWSDRLRAAGALPRGLRRKMGLTRVPSDALVPR